MISPLLTKDVKEGLPKEDSVVAFGETLDTFSTMKKIEANGKTTIRGGQSTNDSDLKKLQQYSHLDTLDISASVVEGTGFRALRSTTEIVRVDMQSTVPSDVGLRAIAATKGLKSLSLTDCDALENKSLALLARSETLEDFSFGGKTLTEDSFKYLQTYPSLQSVYLDEFRISRVGVQELLKIPKLQTLSFNECELDKSGFEELKKLVGPLFNLEFSDTDFTIEMVSQLANVHTRNITLASVETTSVAFVRFKKDPRYLWTKLKVDGKLVDAR